MIRKLAVGDGAIWRAIRLESLKNAPSAFSAKLDDWAQRPLSDFEAQLGKGGTFVAEDAGRVVGCACLDPDDNPQHAERGWLMSVYMSPEARGRGHAWALIGAVAAEAKARGMTALLLDVGLANDAARRAYARAGFREVPMAERPDGSDSACELTMRLEL